MYPWHYVEPPGGKKWEGETAMDNKTAGFIHLHLAVLLFGLAGLFGKLLVQPAVVIVLGRAFFAAASLVLILTCTGKQLVPSRPIDYLFLLLLGMLLAAHWVAFFRSIQVSTVAVGLFTFSTFPVFVVFLEPLFLGEKLQVRSVFIAVVAFGGVTLMVTPGGGDVAGRGAVWGVFSGFTFAFLSIMNRKFVQRYDALLLALYQNAAAAIVLSPLFFTLKPHLNGRDLTLLMLLGVVFTAISHSLFISGLKRVRTRIASIIACLEPVYGVAFAMLLLGEIPGIRVLAGGVLILGMALQVTVRPDRALVE